MPTEVLLITAQGPAGYSGQALLCGGHLIEARKYSPREALRRPLQETAQILAREMDAPSVVTRTIEPPAGAWTWPGLLEASGVHVESTRGESVEIMRRKAGLPVVAMIEVPYDAYATISRLSAMHGKSIGDIVGALSYFEEAIDEHFEIVGHGQAMFDRCLELMEEAESKRLEMGSQRKNIGPRL